MSSGRRCCLSHGRIWEGGGGGRGREEGREGGGGRGEEGGGRREGEGEGEEEEIKKLNNTTTCVHVQCTIQHKINKLHM